MQADNGWDESARAYIAFQDEGDMARTQLLDPLMLRECGDVRGASVIDVGCGEGRFCRMLEERGARVTGIDITREMMTTARERGTRRLAACTAEALPFADRSFQLAVSYITLVDIPDFRAAISEMARVLRPGGSLVVANVGIVSASSEPNGGWRRDEAGKRLFVPIDRYGEEWSQLYDWRGVRIRNWHRPMSAYMQSYLAAGLILRAFMEPVPEDETLRAHPDYERSFRMPWFTLMRWEKP